MSEPEQGGRVLVCDLDESLVLINTFPVFVPFALIQLAIRLRWLKAASLARAAAARRLGRLSHPRFKEEVIKAAEGIPPAVIARWAAGIVRDHLNAQVAQVVRSWRGPRLISTAAPELYAQHIGDLLGFDRVQGSIRTPAGFHDNSGPAKVTRLTSAIALPVDLVITDDGTADAPLIAAAKSHMLVTAGGL